MKKLNVAIQGQRSEVTREGTGKPTVGYYGITGCAGCQLSVIFNEDDLIDLVNAFDIKAFPFIREQNSEGSFDIAFVEGLVASEEDKEKVIKIREQAKVLVALGACAHTGCVPAYRHFTLKENYEHLLYAKNHRIQDVEPAPISKFVKVDLTIPGCPPNKTQILSAIKDILKGKLPMPYKDPVCVECRQRGNTCLLDIGKPCLGPITTGGCESVCPNGGFECWGCRGPTEDMNLKALVKLFREKNIPDDVTRQRLLTFAGLVHDPKMLEEVFSETPDGGGAA